MKNQNECQTLEIIPNYTVKLTKSDGTLKPIEIHSNVFIDIEFCEFDDHLLINLIGLTKDKNIVYGLHEIRGVQTAPGANTSENTERK